MSENFMGLWPTPKASGNRNSRKAIIGGHPKHPSKSDLSLEQALEVSAGILPREVNDPSELPARFREALAPTVSPQLTLFAEAFPASHTPSLVDVADLPTSGTSGPSSPESFASLDPDGSWRKTCQGCSQVTLDGSLERFSETWPRAGMTRNGTAYRRQPLAPLTDGTESGSSLIPTATTQDHFSARVTANRKKVWTSHPGTTLLDYARLWPTPQAFDAVSHVRTPEALARAKTKGGSNNLREVVHLWSSPTVRDANTLKKVMRGRGSSDKGNELIQPLPVQVGGTLNPTWVEWLMGYPTEWTVCEDWVTRSSLRSRSGSRTGSKPRKGSHDV